MRGAGDPVGLPGLAALALDFFAFAVALVAARRRVGGKERGSTRSRRSMLGIAVQALGIGLTGYGVQRVELDPLGAKALVEAAAVALMMAGTVALFVAASRAMGRNWSLVARTRSDYRLVEHGPFARVRHPIYVSTLLMMVAVAVAFGHTTRLLLTVPVYAVGTWLRLAEEERLLRDRFRGRR